MNYATKLDITVRFWQRLFGQNLTVDISEGELIETYIDVVVLGYILRICLTLSNLSELFLKPER